MKRLVIFFIKIYRLCHYFYPPCCKYIPTCSAYAQEAFRRYPLGRACAMTIRRLLRCNPFAPGGIDPVV